MIVLLRPRITAWLPARLFHPSATNSDNFPLAQVQVAAVPQPFQGFDVCCNEVLQPTDSQWPLTLPHLGLILFKTVKIFTSSLILSSRQSRLFLLTFIYFSGCRHVASETLLTFYSHLRTFAIACFWHWRVSDLEYYSRWDGFVDLVA